MINEQLWDLLSSGGERIAFSTDLGRLRDASLGVTQLERKIVDGEARLRNFLGFGIVVGSCDSEACPTFMLLNFVAGPGLLGLFSGLSGSVDFFGVEIFGIGIRLLVRIDFKDFGYNNFGHNEWLIIVIGQPGPP